MKRRHLNISAVFFFALWSAACGSKSGGQMPAGYGTAQAGLTEGWHLFSTSTASAADFLKNVPSEMLTLFSVDHHYDAEAERVVSSYTPETSLTSGRTYWAHVASGDSAEGALVPPALTGQASGEGYFVQPTRNMRVHELGAEKVSRWDGATQQLQLLAVTDSVKAGEAYWVASPLGCDPGPWAFEDAVRLLVGCRLEHAGFRVIPKSVWSSVAPLSSEPTPPPARAGAGTRLVLHHTATAQETSVQALETLRNSGADPSGLQAHFVLAQDEAGRWQVYEGARVDLSQPPAQIDIAVMGTYEAFDRAVSETAHGFGPEASEKAQQPPPGAAVRLLSLVAHLSQQVPTLRGLYPYGQGENAVSPGASKSPGSAALHLVSALDGRFFGAGRPAEDLAEDLARSLEDYDGHLHTDLGEAEAQTGEAKDSTAPLVYLIAGNDVAVTAQSQYRLEGVVYDDDLLEFSLNGVVLGGHNQSFSQDLLLVPGRNAFSVSAVDGSGNTTQVKKQVIYDADAPRIEVLAPEPQALAEKNAVTLGGTVSDATLKTFTINGMPITLRGETFVLPVDVAKLPLGLHPFELWAADEAGLSTRRVVGFLVDEHGVKFVPGLPDDDKAPEDIERGHIGVHIDVQASVADTDLVLVVVDAASLTEEIPLSRLLDGGAGPRFKRATLFFEDLKSVDPEAIEAIDWKDVTPQESEVSLTYNFFGADEAPFSPSDVTYPALVVANPGQSLTYTNVPMVRLEGRAVDENLSYVRVDGIITSTVSGDFTTFVKLTEERTDLVIAARDLAGLEVQVRRTLIFDPKPPVLVVEGGAERTVYDADHVLRGRVTDTQLRSLSLTHGGTQEETPIDVDDDGGFEISLSLEEGVNRFTLVATDRANNATSQTIRRTLEETFVAVQETDAPRGLYAWADGDTAQLRWRQPGQFADGTRLPPGLKPTYRVYRDGTPLVDEPQIFHQGQVPSSPKTYQYHVTAVLQGDEGVEYESAPSDRIDLAVGFEAPVAPLGELEGAASISEGGLALSTPQVVFSEVGPRVYAHLAYVVRGDEEAPDEIRYARSDRFATEDSFVFATEAVGTAPEGTIISDIALAAFQGQVVIGWIEQDESGSASRVVLHKSDQAGLDAAGQHTFQSFQAYNKSEAWKRDLDMAFDHQGLHHMIWNEANKVYYYSNFQAEEGAQGERLNVFDEQKRQVNHELVKYAHTAEIECEDEGRQCCTDRYTDTYALAIDPEDSLACKNRGSCKPQFGVYLERTEETYVETPSLHVSRDSVTIVARQTRMFDNLPRANPNWEGLKSHFLGPVVPPPFSKMCNGRQTWYAGDAKEYRKGFRAAQLVDQYGCALGVPSNVDALIAQEKDYEAIQNFGKARGRYYAYNEAQGHPDSWFQYTHQGLWHEDDQVKVAQRPLRKGAWSNPRTEALLVPRLLEDQGARVEFEAMEVEVEDGFREGVWRRGPLENPPPREPGGEHFHEEGTQFEETLLRWRIATIERFSAERDGDYQACEGGSSGDQGEVGPSYAHVHAGTAGELYAVYERGSKKDPNDPEGNAIQFVSSPDGGLTWGAPQSIGQGYMPSLGVAKRGEIGVLYYAPDSAFVADNGTALGQIKLARSDDGDRFETSVVNEGFDEARGEKRLYPAKPIHWRGYGSGADYYFGVPSLSTYEDLWVASFVKGPVEADDADEIMTNRISAPEARTTTVFAQGPAVATQNQAVETEITCRDQYHALSEGCTVDASSLAFGTSASSFVGEYVATQGGTVDGKQTLWIPGFAGTGSAHTPGGAALAGSEDPRLDALVEKLLQDPEFRRMARRRPGLPDPEVPGNNGRKGLRTSRAFRKAIANPEFRRVLTSRGRRLPADEALFQEHANGILDDLESIQGGLDLSVVDSPRLHRAPAAIGQRLDQGPQLGIELFRGDAAGNYQRALSIRDGLYLSEFDLQAEYVPDEEDRDSAFIARYERVWAYTQGIALAQFARQGDARAPGLAQAICREDVAVWDTNARGESIILGWHFSWNTNEDDWKDARLVTGATAWVIHGLGAFLSSEMSRGEAHAQIRNEVQKCYAAALVGLADHRAGDLASDPQDQWLMTAGTTTRGLKYADSPDKIPLNLSDFGLTGGRGAPRELAYYHILDAIGYTDLGPQEEATIGTFVRDQYGEPDEATAADLVLGLEQFGVFNALKERARAENVVTEHNLDTLSVLNHAISHWDEVTDGLTDEEKRKVGQLEGVSGSEGLAGLITWRDGLRDAIFTRLWDDTEDELREAQIVLGKLEDAQDALDTVRGSSSEILKAGEAKRGAVLLEHALAHDDVGRVVTGGGFVGGAFHKSPFSAIDNCSWLSLSVDYETLPPAFQDKLASCLDYTIWRFTSTNLTYEGDTYYGAFYFTNNFVDKYVEQSVEQEDLYHIEATTGLIQGLLYFHEALVESHPEVSARYLQEATLLWADMQRFLAANGTPYATRSIQDLMTQLSSATAAIWFVDVYDYFAKTHGDVDQPLKNYTHGTDLASEYPIDAQRAFASSLWRTLESRAVATKRVSPIVFYGTSAYGSYGHVDVDGPLRDYFVAKPSWFTESHSKGTAPSKTITGYQGGFHLDMLRHSPVNTHEIRVAAWTEAQSDGAGVTYVFEGGVKGDLADDPDSTSPRYYNRKLLLTVMVDGQEVFVAEPEIDEDGRFHVEIPQGEALDIGGQGAFDKRYPILRVTAEATAGTFPEDVVLAVTPWRSFAHVVPRSELAFEKRAREYIGQIGWWAFHEDTGGEVFQLVHVAEGGLDVIGEATLPADPLDHRAPVYLDASGRRQDSENEGLATNSTGRPHIVWSETPAALKLLTPDGAVPVPRVQGTSSESSEQEPASEALALVPVFDAQEGDSKLVVHSFGPRFGGQVPSVWGKATLPEGQEGAVVEINWKGDAGSFQSVWKPATPSGNLLNTVAGALGVPNDSVLATLERKFEGHTLAYAPVNTTDLTLDFHAVGSWKTPLTVGSQLFEFQATGHLGEPVSVEDHYVLVSLLVDHGKRREDVLIGEAQLRENGTFQIKGSVMLDIHYPDLTKGVPMARLFRRSTADGVPDRMLASTSVLTTAPSNEGVASVAAISPATATSWSAKGFRGEWYFHQDLHSHDRDKAVESIVLRADVGGDKLVEASNFWADSLLENLEEQKERQKLIGDTARKIGLAAGARVLSGRGGYFGGLVVSETFGAQDEDSAAALEVTYLEDQALAIVAAVNQGDTVVRPWIDAMLSGMVSFPKTPGHPVQLPFALRADTGRAVAPYFQTGSQMLAAYSLLWYVQHAPASGYRDHVQERAEALLASLEGLHFDPERGRFTAGLGDPTPLRRLAEGVVPDAADGLGPQDALALPASPVAALEDHVYAYFALRLAEEVTEQATYGALADKVDFALSTVFWQGSAGEGSTEPYSAPVAYVDVGQGALAGDVRGRESASLYLLYATERGLLGRAQRALDLVALLPESILGESAQGPQVFSERKAFEILAKRGARVFDPRQEEIAWNDHLTASAGDGLSTGELAGLVVAENPRGFLGVHAASMFGIREGTMVSALNIDERLRDLYISTVFALLVSEAKPHLLDPLLRRLVAADLVVAAMDEGLPLRGWLGRHQETYRARLMETVARLKDFCEAQIPGRVFPTEGSVAASRLGLACDEVGPQVARLLRRRFGSDDVRHVFAQLERPNDAFELLALVHLIHAPAYGQGDGEGTFGALRADFVTSAPLLSSSMMSVQDPLAFAADVTSKEVASALTAGWREKVRNGILALENQDTPHHYELDGIDFIQTTNPSSPAYFSREAMEYRMLQTVGDVAYRLNGYPMLTVRYPAELLASEAGPGQAEREENVRRLRRLINLEADGRLPLAAEKAGLSTDAVHRIMRTGLLTYYDFVRLMGGFGFSEEEAQSRSSQFVFLAADSAHWPVAAQDQKRSAFGMLADRITGADVALALDHVAAPIDGTQLVGSAQAPRVYFIDDELPGTHNDCYKVFRFNEGQGDGQVTEEAFLAAADKSEWLVDVIMCDETSPWVDVSLAAAVLNGENGFGSDKGFNPRYAVQGREKATLSTGYAVIPAIPELNPSDRAQPLVGGETIDLYAWNGAQGAPRDLSQPSITVEEASLPGGRVAIHLGGWGNSENHDPDGCYRAYAIPTTGVNFGEFIRMSSEDLARHERTGCSGEVFVDEVSPPGETLVTYAFASRSIDFSDFADAIFSGEVVLTTVGEVPDQPGGTSLEDDELYQKTDGALAFDGEVKDLVRAAEEPEDTLCTSIRVKNHSPLEGGDVYQFSEYQVLGAKWLYTLHEGGDLFETIAPGETAAVTACVKATDADALPKGADAWYSLVKLGLTNTRTGETVTVTKPVKLRFEERQNLVVPLAADGVLKVELRGCETYTVHNRGDHAVEWHATANSVYPDPQAPVGMLVHPEAPRTLAAGAEDELVVCAQARELDVERIAGHAITLGDVALINLTDGQTQSFKVSTKGDDVSSVATLPSGIPGIENCGSGRGGATVIKDGYWSYEVLPNVVKNDGSEPFFVEVRTSQTLGELKDLGLTLAGFIEGPDGATSGARVLFRDDGISPDHTKGDGIYVAGPFRYVGPAQKYFGDDRNGPVGASVTKVGFDLGDPTVGTFAIAPSLGLIDSTIAERLAPNLKTTNNGQAGDYFANVCRNQSTTQSELRGLGFDPTGLAQDFYAAGFADEFQFMVGVSTNHVEKIGQENINKRGGHSRVVRDNTPGLDVAEGGVDVGDRYGSQKSLEAVAYVDVLGPGVSSYRVTHEIMHRFGAYWKGTVNVEGIDLPLTDGNHYLLNVGGGSLLSPITLQDQGFSFEDQGNGKVRIVCQNFRKATKVDEYLMGVRPASTAGSIPVLVSESQTGRCGDVIPGRVVPVSVANHIVPKWGSRPAASRTNYRIAFVGETLGRTMTPRELAFYETLAKHYTRELPEGALPVLDERNWVSIDHYFPDSIRFESALLLDENFVAGPVTQIAFEQPLGIVGHWSFDGASLSEDKSFLRHAAVVDGESLPGMGGGALKGTLKVDAPALQFGKNEAVMISVWVWPDPTSKTHEVILGNLGGRRHGNPGSVRQGWEIAREGNGQVSARTTNLQGAPQVKLSGQLNVGEWNHIVWRVRPKQETIEFALMVNGLTKTESRGKSFFADFKHPAAVVLGGGREGRDFTGTTDELRFYRGKYTKKDALRLFHGEEVAHGDPESKMRVLTLHLDPDGASAATASGVTVYRNHYGVTELVFEDGFVPGAVVKLPASGLPPDALPTLEPFEVAPFLVDHDASSKFVDHVGVTPAVEVPAWLQIFGVAGSAWADDTEDGVTYVFLPGDSVTNWTQDLLNGDARVVSLALDGVKEWAPGELVSTDSSNPLYKPFEAYRPPADFEELPDAFFVENANINPFDGLHLEVTAGEGLAWGSFRVTHEVKDLRLHSGISGGDIWDPLKKAIDRMEVEWGYDKSPRTYKAVFTYPETAEGVDLPLWIGGVKFPVTVKYLENEDIQSLTGEELLGEKLPFFFDTNALRGYEGHTFVAYMQIVNLTGYDPDIAVITGGDHDVMVLTGEDDVETVKLSDIPNDRIFTRKVSIKVKNRALVVREPVVEHEFFVRNAPAGLYNVSVHGPDELEEEGLKLVASQRQAFVNTEGKAPLKLVFDPLLVPRAEDMTISLVNVATGKEYKESLALRAHPDGITPLDWSPQGGKQVLFRDFEHPEAAGVGSWGVSPAGLGGRRFLDWVEGSFAFHFGIDKLTTNVASYGALWKTSDLPLIVEPKVLTFDVKSVTQAGVGAQVAFTWTENSGERWRSAPLALTENYQTMVLAFPDDFVPDGYAQAQVRSDFNDVPDPHELAAIAFVFTAGEEDRKDVIFALDHMILHEGDPDDIAREVGGIRVIPPKREEEEELEPEEIIEGPNVEFAGASERPKTINPEDFNLVAQTVTYLDILAGRVAVPVEYYGAFGTEYLLESAWGTLSPDDPYMFFQPGGQTTEVKLKPNIALLKSLRNEVAKLRGETDEETTDVWEVLFFVDPVTGERLGQLPIRIDLTVVGRASIDGPDVDTSLEPQLFFNDFQPVRGCTKDCDPVWGIWPVKDKEDYGADVVFKSVGDSRRLVYENPQLLRLGAVWLTFEQDLTLYEALSFKIQSPEQADKRDDKNGCVHVRLVEADGDAWISQAYNIPVQEEREIIIPVTFFEYSENDVTKATNRRPNFNSIQSISFNFVPNSDPGVSDHVVYSIDTLTGHPRLNSEQPATEPDCETRHDDFEVVITSPDFQGLDPSAHPDIKDLLPASKTYELVEKGVFHGLHWTSETPHWDPGNHEANRKSIHVHESFAGDKAKMVAAVIHQLTHHKLHQQGNFVVPVPCPNARQGVICPDIYNATRTPKSERMWREFVYNLYMRAEAEAVLNSLLALREIDERHPGELGDISLSHILPVKQDLGPSVDKQIQQAIDDAQVAFDAYWASSRTDQEPVIRALLLVVQWRAEADGASLRGRFNERLLDLWGSGLEPNITQAENPFRRLAEIDPYMYTRDKGNGHYDRHDDPSDPLYDPRDQDAYWYSRVRPPFQGVVRVQYDDFLVELDEEDGKFRTCGHVKGTPVPCASAGKIAVDPRPRQPIAFSGYTFTAKKSEEAIAPGPNLWSETFENVFVDDEGLHLRVTPHPTEKDRWYSAEVIADKNLGYGQYIFTIEYNMLAAPHNVVLGLFLWDPDRDAADVHHREIDIEFSRWEDEDRPVAQFAVPPYEEGMFNRFEPNGELLKRADYITTYVMDWQQDRILFHAYYGPEVEGRPFEEWEYDQAYNIAPPGEETVRMNLWLVNQKGTSEEGKLAPLGGKPVEAIIKSFRHERRPLR